MTSKPQARYIPAPLKLIGRRALISLDLVPFINKLSPLSLALSTLRNPPGLIYSKKIFFHLRKVLLQRTFNKRYIKNQQKAKLLIRGYELLRKEKQKKLNPQITPISLLSEEKFNLNFVKQYFDAITKEQSQQNVKNNYLNFLETIPLIVEKRRQFDYKLCLKIRRVLLQIIEKEKSKELQNCQILYQQKFLNLRIPWSQNNLKDIEEFGKQLWERYLSNQMNDKNPNKKNTYLCKSKKIQKSKINKGDLQFQRPETRNSRLSKQKNGQQNLEASRKNQKYSKKHEMFEQSESPTLTFQNEEINAK